MRSAIAVIEPSCSVRETRRPPCSQVTSRPWRVERVAVRVAGGVPEDADRAGRLVPAQHAVVRDVAPDEVPRGREVDRALRPAAASVEPLDHWIAADAAEAIVQDLELRRDGPRSLRACYDLPHNRRSVFAGGNGGCARARRACALRGARGLDSPPRRRARVRRADRGRRRAHASSTSPAGSAARTSATGTRAAVAAIHEQVDLYLHQCFMVGTYEPYVEVCRLLAELSPCGKGEQRSLLAQLRRRGDRERGQDRACRDRPARRDRVRQRASTAARS